MVKNSLSSFLSVAAALGILIVGIVVGSLVTKARLDSKTSVEAVNDPDQRSKGDFSFISPLLDCGYPPTTKILPVKTAALTQIQQNKDKKDISYAAVYFRDLNNGPWFGIDEKELFAPASLTKIPLMIAYFKQAETNPELLKQELVFEQSDANLVQNIRPEYALEPGKAYTVEWLINLMIVDSNNDAHMLLIDAIDNNVLQSVYRDLDIDIKKAIQDPSGNSFSVRDYGSFFRMLYNSSYLSEEMSERALMLLSKVNFKEGLVAGVPKEAVVAHKFGERSYKDNGEKQLHDCGIVYAPQKPYVLCVMTRGDDLTRMASAIKDISAGVFQSFVIDEAQK